MLRDPSLILLHAIDYPVIWQSSIPKKSNLDPLVIHRDDGYVAYMDAVENFDKLEPAQGNEVCMLTIWICAL